MQILTVLRRYLQSFYSEVSLGVYEYSIGDLVLDAIVEIPYAIKEFFRKRLFDLLVIDAGALANLVIFY